MGPGVLQGAETLGEAGAVFQGLELRRVVRMNALPPSAAGVRSRPEARWPAAHDGQVACGRTLSRSAAAPSRLVAPFAHTRALETTPSVRVEQLRFASRCSTRTRPDRGRQRPRRAPSGPRTGCHFPLRHPLCCCPAARLPHAYRRSPHLFRGCTSARSRFPEPHRAHTCCRASRPSRHATRCTRDRKHRAPRCPRPRLRSPRPQRRRSATTH